MATLTGWRRNARLPFGAGSLDDRLRHDDHAAVRLLADRLGSDCRVIAQREVHPAPLKGRHRLELQLREIAAAAVALDVDEDAGPLAHLAREHEVHDVLEGGKPLALPADEGADDVEAVGLAGLDVDRDREPHVLHELLEQLMQHMGSVSYTH